MSLWGTVLVIALVLALLGGVAPVYPYNRGWGWYPFGGLLGTILVIFLILILARAI
jgi:hypothetical protein